MDSKVEEELDLAAVKSRSIKGMATLTGGGVIATTISFIGTLIITAILGPAEFGIYGLVLSLVVILNYFSDIGLAASLIQKKEKLTTSDLRTTFTIQEALVVFLILVALILSPFIKNYYNFGQSEYYLFLALLGSFFLSSLKSIPAVILERSLRFDLIVIIRIIETFVFNLIVILSALYHMGVMSYAVAILSQNLSGLALYFYFKPWPIGLAVSKESLKKLLKFGVPYQLNSLLAVAKDQFVNLFLYRIVGTGGMGLVNWGFNYSQMPQRLIMDNATKVAFPALSRIQDNPGELKKSIEKLLQFVCLLIFPTLVLISLAWSHLVYIYPRWLKWEGGLIPLYLFCFSAAMSCLSTPLTNTLYAIGKAKIVSKLMVMWLVLEWLLKPLLATKFGFIGIAYAAALISLSSLVPFVITQKQINFSIRKSLFLPLAATIVMLAAGLFTHPLGIIWTLLISSAFYVTSLLVFGRSQLIADIKPFFYHFRAKV